jgi:hypothetical protein
MPPEMQAYDSLTMVLGEIKVNLVLASSTPAGIINQSSNQIRRNTTLFSLAQRRSINLYYPSYEVVELVVGSGVEKAKGLARSRGLSSANSLPVPTAGAGVLTKARRVENRPNTYARIWRNLALHSPAAWVIGQLHCHLRLRFDEGKLHKRFPLYPKSMKLAGAHVAAPVPAVASTSGTTNNSSEASTLVEATRATQTGALPRWIDKDIK